VPPQKRGSDYLSLCAQAALLLCLQRQNFLFMKWTWTSGIICRDQHPLRKLLQELLQTNQEFRSWSNSKVSSYKRDLILTAYLKPSHTWKISDDLICIGQTCPLVFSRIQPDALIIRCTIKVAFKPSRKSTTSRNSIFTNWRNQQQKTSLKSAKWGRKRSISAGEYFYIKDIGNAVTPHTCSWHCQAGKNWPKADQNSFKKDRHKKKSS